MKNSTKKMEGKMKTTKRIRLLIYGLVMMLIVSCFLTGCSDENLNNPNPYNLKVEKATSDFYVNDFANILSDSQKSEIMAKAVSMDEEYSGIQVVLTTVESLDKVVVEYAGTKPEKFEIEQVAYAMFNQYGIGQDDMGILILFSTGDREVRIETGRQMQNFITDSKSGQLLDNYGMEYFKNDQFAEGLISVQNAVIDEIKTQVPKDWSKESDSITTESTKETVVTTEKPEVTDTSKEKDNSATGLIVGFFISIGGGIAAIGLAIYNAITGRKKQEALEKKREEDLKTQKQKFEFELNEVRENYEERIEKNRIREFREIDKLQNNHRSELESKEYEIRNLQKELANANNQIYSLKSDFINLNEKYARAQTLHPEFNFEEEIKAMIESEYEEKAKEIDQEIGKVVGLPASKDRVESFKNALDLFNRTEPEVKKYVFSNIERLHSTYQESVSLRIEFERAEQEKRDKEAANNAYSQIKDIYEKNPFGNYKTYNILTKALSIYTALTFAQKEVFPDKSLLSNLQRTVDSAKEDFDDFNAAGKAEKSIHSIIDRIYSADEDDRDNLEKAMKYYSDLSDFQKIYFPIQLLSKLKDLISEAEEDHRRQEARRRREKEEKRRREEEEERRRRQRMQSTSSFGGFNSSSNFGGHGGRSGGGGASRGF